MKLTVVGFVVVTAVSARSFAADYPHRAALDTRSSTVGIGQVRLPLLQRQVGPGANTITSQLLARWTSNSGAITTSGTYKTRQDNVDVRVLGDNGWKLTVRSDGSAAEFSNWAYRTAHLTAVAPAQQPTLTTLAGWGRTFITEHLNGIVVLGPNEELVESHALFESQGQVTADSTKPTVTSIVGAIVVFSRTINGHALVGEGSKIAIRFTVDGIPWAFSYDWPSYLTTGTDQAVLPLATIRQRQSKVLQAPAKAKSQTEERFECGYFDPGVRHRDPSALVQGGCTSQHVFSEIGDLASNAIDATNGIFRSSRVIATPTGATIAADKSWPEAVALQGNSATQPDSRVSVPNNTITK